MKKWIEKFEYIFFVRFVVAAHFIHKYDRLGEQDCDQGEGFMRSSGFQSQGESYRLTCQWHFSFILLLSICFTKFSTFPKFDEIGPVSKLQRRVKGEEFVKSSRFQSLRKNCRPLVTFFISIVIHIFPRFSIRSPTR